jgi:endonuclease/exonuclease/phosphatase family metal-dependent hydrolase
LRNSAGTQMRIATWNLERPKANGWKRNPLIQDKIREIDADIWILTETNAVIVPESKRDPLAGYVPLASVAGTLHSLGEYSRGENCTTIWSRYGIKRTIETFDRDTAVCAEIDTPLGLILVYGTILTYHGDKGPRNNSKSWVEHDKEIVRHGEDWEKIRHRVQRTPLIVAGDFNQTRDGSRAYCSPKGIALLDKELQRNNLVSLTDEDFGASNKLTVSPWSETGVRHNIDHICVTAEHFEVQHIGAWDHFTSTQKLSDHNGVFVDLTLRQ